MRAVLSLSLCFIGNFKYTNWLFILYEIFAVNLGMKTFDEKCSKLPVLKIYCNIVISQWLFKSSSNFFCDARNTFRTLYIKYKIFNRVLMASGGQIMIFLKMFLAFILNSRKSCVNRSVVRKKKKWKTKQNLRFTQACFYARCKVARGKFSFAVYAFMLISTKSVHIAQSHWNCKCTKKQQHFNEMHPKQKLLAKRFIYKSFAKP